ncbi:hypothetical protein SAMN05444392_101314 [Seinonella peptonophila]|uniref:Glycerophosphoryl diester phosphodiesterase membrane domain-containing protein n=1 Tax=Seinonella peptonophila TaxID=112248 RepID=A0A1M4T5H0_9BACL|nr:hypothetical protein [Seinonella peptonophila]SHE39634.1 hypothetical protein SAMN05444392_101314 [Seinonella peptonophila]
MKQNQNSFHTLTFYQLITQSLTYYRRTFFLLFIISLLFTLPSYLLEITLLDTQNPPLDYSISQIWIALSFLLFDMLLTFPLLSLLCTGNVLKETISTLSSNWFRKSWSHILFLNFLTLIVFIPSFSLFFLYLIMYQALLQLLTFLIGFLLLIPTIYLLIRWTFIFQVSIDDPSKNYQQIFAHSWKLTSKNVLAIFILVVFAMIILLLPSILFDEIASQFQQWKQIFLLLSYFVDALCNPILSIFISLLYLKYKNIYYQSEKLTS